MGNSQQIQSGKTEVNSRTEQSDHIRKLEFVDSACYILNIDSGVTTAQINANSTKPLALSGMEEGEVAPLTATASRADAVVELPVPGAPIPSTAAVSSRGSIFQDAEIGNSVEAVFLCALNLSFLVRPGISQPHHHHHRNDPFVIRSKTNRRRETPGDRRPSNADLDQLPARSDIHRSSFVAA